MHYTRHIQISSHRQFLYYTRTPLDYERAISDPRSIGRIGHCIHPVQKHITTDTRPSADNLQGTGRRRIGRIRSQIQFTGHAHVSGYDLLTRGGSGCRLIFEQDTGNIKGSYRYGDQTVASTRTGLYHQKPAF